MPSDPVMWLGNQYYTKIVGSVVPVAWLGVDVPPVETLAVPEGRLKLQIVSHCWQYAHLMVYQLCSLVNYPPKTVDLTYTLFYSEEDKKTVELGALFDAMNIPGIEWDWRPIPRDTLYRRAIGRHQAAKSTTADWVWFSDCDLIFHDGCLDSLAASLKGRQIYLAYPAGEGITAFRSRKPKGHFRWCMVMLPEWRATAAMLVCIKSPISAGGKPMKIQCSAG